MVCVSSKIFLTTSQQPRHVLRKVQSIPSRYSPVRLAKVLILRLPSVRETLCTTELLGRTAPQGTKPYMDGNTKKKKKHIKGPVIRQQLKCCKSNQEEMKKYDYQMELLLQNMFSKYDKACKKNPQNWMYKMTNIVGGLEYQHAHADQGWGMDFEGEKTFPFVATHGFGEHPFSMWLLPRGNRGKNDYGFLHSLPRTALLLMRGDFIHAGGVSWLPRCHMKFYPRVDAGLVRKHPHHYWLKSSFQCDIDEPVAPDSQDERSYLWQHYHFPFAFPSFQHVYNTTTKEVEEIIHYYPEITHGLMDTSKEGRAIARSKLKPKTTQETAI